MLIRLSNNACDVLNISVTFSEAKIKRLKKERDRVPITNPDRDPSAVG